MKTPEVLIRKYSDRRLYDTSASRYVKLEDVARMVRDGIDVRVVDARSGKDLTHVVLTQIIVEDARDREVALPMQLLTQLVRASDKATHDFLSWYLDSTIDLYKKAQDTVQTRLSDAKKAVGSPLEFVRNLLSGHSWPPPGPRDRAMETEELRRRILELQAQLKKQDKPRRKPSSRTSKHKTVAR